MIQNKFYGVILHYDLLDTILAADIIIYRNVSIIAIRRRFFSQSLALLYLLYALLKKNFGGTCSAYQKYEHYVRASVFIYKPQ